MFGIPEVHELFHHGLYALICFGESPDKPLLGKVIEILEEQRVTDNGLERLRKNSPQAYRAAMANMHPMMIVDVHGRIYKESIDGPDVLPDLVSRNQNLDSRQCNEYLTRSGLDLVKNRLEQLLQSKFGPDKELASDDVRKFQELGLNPLFVHTAFPVNEGERLILIFLALDPLPQVAAPAA